MHMLQAGEGNKGVRLPAILFITTETHGFFQQPVLILSVALRHASVQHSFTVLAVFPTASCPAG